MERLAWAICHDRPSLDKVLGDTTWAIAKYNL